MAGGRRVKSKLLIQHRRPFTFPINLSFPPYTPLRIIFFASTILSLSRLWLFQKWEPCVLSLFICSAWHLVITHKMLGELLLCDLGGFSEFWMIAGGMKLRMSYSVIECWNGIIGVIWSKGSPWSKIRIVFTWESCCQQPLMLLDTLTVMWKAGLREPQEPSPGGQGHPLMASTVRFLMWREWCLKLYDIARGLCTRTGKIASVNVKANALAWCEVYIIVSPSLCYYSPCIGRLMKGKQNYSIDANWGEATVSYCLFYLELGQGGGNKQIKLYELSMKTCHHPS